MALVTVAKLSQDEEYEKDYFLLTRWLLRGAGLWAPKTQSAIVTLLYKCFSIFIILYVDVWFCATEFVVLKDTSSNINTLIKNIGFACTHLLGTIKVLFWFGKQQQLKNLLGTLESEEWHYESCDGFYPAQILNSCRRIGIIYAASFFLMGYTTASLSYIPLLITTYTNPNYVENEQGNLTFHQDVPYFSWIPFKYDTPNSYIIAVLYQMGPVYHYAFTVVGMDSLFMNILNFTAGHMAVLRGAFKSIRARCVIKMEAKGRMVENDTNNDELNQMMMGEFKRCIQHLQTMFSVCEQTEDIFTYLTLVQVLFALFIFVTCLFQVSTAPIASKAFATEMVYMMAMCTELIMYSWFGNEVTLKASEITEALWQSDWLETPYSYRTNILITMIRMGRPLHMTVGKFAPLTLNTFVSIVKSSYSFFAVLKHVNNQ